MQLLVTYLMAGLFFTAIASNSHPIHWRAKLVVLLAWPWIVYIEASPRMVKFIKWAKKKR